MIMLIDNNYESLNQLALELAKILKYNGKHQHPRA